MFGYAVDFEESLAVVSFRGSDTEEEVAACFSTVVDLYVRLAGATRPAVVLLIEPEDEANYAWLRRLIELADAVATPLLVGVVSASDEMREVVGFLSHLVSTRYELFADPSFDGAVAEIGRRRGKPVRASRELLRSAGEMARLAGSGGRSPLN